MLNRVEFREVGELVQVDKVKVVACDGKGLYDKPAFFTRNCVLYSLDFDMTFNKQHFAILCSSSS